MQSTASTFKTDQGVLAPNLQERSPVQAEQNARDSLKPSSEIAYIRMRNAFIRWHVFGCFAAAAEYANARTTWELALMERGDRG